MGFANAALSQIQSHVCPQLCIASEDVCVSALPPLASISPACPTSVMGSSGSVALLQIRGLQLHNMELCVTLISSNLVAGTPIFSVAPEHSSLGRGWVRGSLPGVMDVLVLAGVGFGTIMDSICGSMTLLV